MSTDASMAGRPEPMHVDTVLITIVLLLFCMGTVMVTSSSMAMAEKQDYSALYYFWRHIETMVLAAIAAVFIWRLPMVFWMNAGPWMLLLSLLLLTVVLYGEKINGSTRWLCMGKTCFQVSELAKLSLIIYLAGFLVRHRERLQQGLSALLAPAMVLAILAILLIKEPDFGALVVMFFICAGLLFLSHVHLRQLFGLTAISVALLSAYIWITGYHIERLWSFTAPCAPEFSQNTGYQLCQALIAMGHGGLFGVGLGGSVQKLFYLPEAHTDFILAVLGEELGLIGVLAVIVLYAVLVWRAFRIAKQAAQLHQPFSFYVAAGIGYWIAVQALIGIGVNTGLLPTKGLTLPFLSYGGSNLLMMMISVALLLRIDQETQPVRHSKSVWRNPS